jgi:hypothetical protein
MQFWNDGDMTYFNIPPRGVTLFPSADSAASGANIRISKQRARLDQNGHS